MSLSFIDKMVSAYTKGETMPLKGKAKITLTNTVTGEKKVVEKENMVTHAVADILSKNMCGLANYSTLMPLKNMYAGVMCFQNTLTENANNYNPPSERTNPMIAHAGDTAHVTASPYRGNPNGGETIVTDTSIKFVWDWATNQGNGTINCVCLVPHTLGNMGLKPFDNTITPISEFGKDTVGNNSAWNETISKQYPFTISSDGKTAKTVWLNGTTFKEYTVRHDYFAFGIMRAPRTWQDVSNRSATVRQAPSSANRRFIFDDDTYYYIACATSATAIQIDKVAKSDFTVTTADITLSGTSLYTTNFNSSVKNAGMRIYPFDGTNLYYPNSSLTSFYKIPLANPANVELLSGTISVNPGRTSVNATQFCTPIVISNELILGDNYIINGNTVYSIKQLQNFLGNSAGTPDTYLCFVRHGAAMYGNMKDTYHGSTSNTCQGNVLCEMFLSTILNLDEPVVKQNIMTMKIEYTLTES